MIKVGQKLAVYVPEEKSDYYKKINNLSFSAKQSLSGKQIPTNAVASSSAAAEAGSEPAVASVSGGFEYYTVRKGDNLWTIARKYPGISNQDIMKLNNITDVKGLRAGQKLKIRPKS
jgi:membrane-bound lytic murein transglycosylase D